MKARHLVLFLFVLVLAAVGGGGWWLYKSKDQLLKQAVERWAPEILGVAVRLESASIDPIKGTGSLRGLVIGNPSGYSTPHAVSLGEMRIEVVPQTLARDVVVVKELVLVAPDVYYERGKDTDNLAAIQKNAEAWAAAHQPKGDAKKDAGPSKKVIIDSLRIQDGKAHLGNTLTVPIPAITLRDVGRKSNGASAGDAVKQVWSAMVHSVGNLAQQAGAAVKGAAQGAFEGVKSLFK